MKNRNFRNFGPQFKTKNNEVIESFIVASIIREIRHLYVVVVQ